MYILDERKREKERERERERERHTHTHTHTFWHCMKQALGGHNDRCILYGYYGGK